MAHGPLRLGFAVAGVVLIVLSLLEPLWWMYLEFILGLPDTVDDVAWWADVLAAAETLWWKLGLLGVGITMFLLGRDFGPPQVNRSRRRRFPK